MRKFHKKKANRWDPQRTIIFWIFFRLFFFASPSGRVQKSHPGQEGDVFYQKKSFFYPHKYLKYLIQIPSSISCNYSWARPPRMWNWTNRDGWIWKNDQLLLVRRSVSRTHPLVVYTGVHITSNQLCAHRIFIDTSVVQYNKSIVKYIPSSSIGAA